MLAARPLAGHLLERSGESVQAAVELLLAKRSARGEVEPGQWQMTAEGRFGRSLGGSTHHLARRRWLLLLARFLRLTYLHTPSKTQEHLSLELLE